MVKPFKNEGGIVPCDCAKKDRERMTYWSDSYIIQCEINRRLESQIIHLKDLIQAKDLIIEKLEKQNADSNKTEA